MCNGIIMICNKTTQPDFTTEEQIAECKKCKHASANVNRSGKTGWCCLFGVRIVKKQSNIIVPDGKIIKPQQQKRTIEKDYKTAIAGHKGGNFELITLAEYMLRRQRCLLCNDKKDCPMRGCSRWRVLVEKTRTCPLKKW